MKSLILIVFMFTLIGCNDRIHNKTKEITEESRQHMIIRTRLGHSIYRFENEEAICYYEYDGGMDCKFKEIK